MNFSILFESTSTITPDDIVILESESKNRDGTERIIFKTKLQTANEINGNRRYYSKDICNNIIENLRPIAKSRSLLQEVDHPFINSSDADVQKKRAVTVDYKSAPLMFV